MRLRVYGALLILASVSMLGCASQRTEPAFGVAPDTRSGIAFDFRGPNNARFTSDATRGRVTLIALVTTYDLASQLLVRRLEELHHNHAPRLNVGAVAMETPRYEVLVGLFPNAIGLTFPVVMADPASLAGDGPFGNIDRIPTLIVLDKRGRLVRRLSSALEPENIHAAIRAAERAW